MTRKLEIRQETSASGVTLRIAGVLVDGQPAERLVWTVRGLLRRGVTALTLDLGGVRMIDCGGLGHLVRCRQAASNRGVALRLAGARGPVREMVRMSALCDAPLLITA